MKGVAKLIWREIVVPSPPNEHPYHTLTIAAAHILLGACVCALLRDLMPGAFALWLTLFGYWLLKERRDLEAGGEPLDGKVDLAMVGVGALYPGPLWWPLLALLGAATAPFVMRLR